MIEPKENSEACTPPCNENPPSFSCVSQPSLNKLHSMRLEKLLRASLVDSRTLRELLWLGVPEDAQPSVRAILWKLAMGYTPFDADSRDESQIMKIRDYANVRNIYFSAETGEVTSKNYIKQLKQIQVDTIRTHPEGYESIFFHPTIQSLMVHVLLIWAIRNPASGYVQGLNDVVTPFIVVFLRGRLEKNTITPDDLNQITQDVLVELESQCYWCLSKLLSRVQDNFIFGQPGVVRMMSKMEEMLSRVAQNLLEHFREENIELFHLCFRWMNCFLTRDLPLEAIMRLWDTYIAEDVQGFSDFHTHVCAVFLMHWSDQLKSMDFQQIHLFLQALPTKTWGVQQVESLLSRAFILKNLFGPLSAAQLE